MVDSLNPTRDEFAALLEESFSENQSQEGSVVKGTVVSIENDLAIVDVGLKTEGRVPLKEFAAPGKPAELVVGDTVEVFLDRIENAIWATLEEGKVLTVDIIGDHAPATTEQFAAEIVSNLDKPSKTWQPRDHKPIRMPRVDPRPDFVHAESWREIGVDLFITSGLSAQRLGDSLVALTRDAPLQLKMISNRGTRVYPPTGGITDCVDHWRCRFVLRDQDGSLTDQAILDLLQRVGPSHHWCHIEKLPIVDGSAGFTRAQGED